MQTVGTRKPPWSLIIIVGVLFVLLLILVMVVGVLIFTRQFNTTTTTRSILGANPVNLLDAKQIDPALALASLGGMSEANVVSEAVEKARPETALATLLFSPNLTSRETAGGFLQLAGQYSAIDQLQKAAAVYEMAGLVAILAPDISDTIRADLLIQISEGLIAINQPELGNFYLDQAFTIAAQSPYLQAAHRRRIFESLHKNYLLIGERLLARESLSLSANPPTLDLVTEPPVLLPVKDPIPLPDAIQRAEAARWQAAQELAILLVERGGAAPESDIDQLAQALVAEDAEKSAFFENEFNNTSQLSYKINVTRAKIEWLAIKYRIARRGFGINLVPEWEARAEEIRAELTKTYETLFALYADLVIALPDASEIDKATEERLRMEILAGELGRYPNYPEEQRRAQLVAATEQLIRTQPETNIFVNVGEVENKQVFTFISLD
jgi:hypothetical protein